MAQKCDGLATGEGGTASLSTAANASEHQQILERIRGEYLEMPGLRLKAEQVQRLCGVKPSVCRVLLESLVEAKFLCVSSDGAYARLRT